MVSSGEMYLTKPDNLKGLYYRIVCFCSAASIWLTAVHTFLPHLNKQRVLSLLAKEYNWRGELI